MRRRFLGVASVVLVTLLAGCFLGPSEEPEPVGPGGANAPAAPDPCQLLTPGEVQQVQGTPTQPGEESQGNLKGERVCSFYEVDSISINISVSVYPSSREYFDGDRAAVAQHFPVEDIKDLGDAAFFSTFIVYVYKEPFTLTVVTAGPGTVEQARAKVVKLAVIATSRL